MTKKFRLFDKHPDAQAWNQLCNLAYKLGINIHTKGLICVDINKSTYHIEDIEGPDYNLFCFPPETEERLTYRKEVVEGNDSASN